MSGYEGTHQDWLEDQASHQLEIERFKNDLALNVNPGDWAHTRLVDFEGWDAEGRLLVYVAGAGLLHFTEQQAVAFANALLSEVEIRQREAEQEYDDRGCECELDWNCPLHQGGPTPIERINDAWASEQTEIDRQHGM